MDNISRRLSCEDTATSIYLSFDAESTMSTACYKTLEAMSDMSALSAIDMDNSVNKTGENHINSTLEAQDNSQIISPLKTVKKIELPDVKLNTPLRALPKNILKEYKALCSTPSREQLLKTVDVTRGSDATRCVDLGLAFLGVDDEKPAYFPPPPPAIIYEENKENALPDTEEVSTLSTCSSVEITTSVIERKMSSVSTVCSITEEESVDEVKVINNIEEIIVSTDVVDKNEVNYLLFENIEVIQNEKPTLSTLEAIKENSENTPKAKGENVECEGITTEYVEENTPTIKDLGKKSVNKKSVSKPRIAVLTRNSRRSACEPNLQENKPSRILSTGSKRQSLLPKARKSTIPIDPETEIPLLMNKILKITNDSNVKTKEVEVKGQHIIDKSTSVDKRRSIMNSIKPRTSLIPSVAGDKRPFSFTNRMSVVVKTTLNSPARKYARKSSMGGVMSSLQRRSVVSQKSNTNENLKIKKPEVIGRSSLLPRTSNITSALKSNEKPLPSFQESSVIKPTTIAQKTSVHSMSKDSENGKTNVVGSLLHNKPNISFTCNVCKEKFRIKSLLDAHRRSHEGDNVTPAFIKKPTSASNASSVLGNTNQCKYCDKKFALTKALHIHLLQNCSKIPPSEKRKLHYTDLNHVEKAQLPDVFSHHNLQSNASNAVALTNATPRQTSLKHNTKTLPKSSTESINDNKDLQKITTDLINCVDGSNMTTSSISVQKIKKITAHAGVYRTPSKSVPCHLCKLTFKSILDYTNHNLTVHGSNKNIREDDFNDFDVKDTTIKSTS
ncbi:uncharacterized protein ACRADG_007727 isoform 1-T3 [Cochliomyia hominivorax]